MTEKEMDRLLRIRTAGSLAGLNQSAHYNRYEATPYEALDALFEVWQPDGSGEFVDFGCGKGRVPFYVNYRFGVSATGIEMSGHLYQEALENQASYLKKAKQKRGSVTFLRCLAEEYAVKPEDTVFFFFNPFSIEVFMTVAGRILQSAEMHPRTIELILYYPSVDYVQFLEGLFELTLDVEVPGMTAQDEHERVLVFRRTA